MIPRMAASITVMHLGNDNIATTAVQQTVQQCQLQSPPPLHQEHDDNHNGNYDHESVAWHPPASAATVTADDRDPCCGPAACTRGACPCTATVHGTSMAMTAWMTHYDDDLSYPHHANDHNHHTHLRNQWCTGHDCRHIPKP